MKRAAYLLIHRLAICSSGTGLRCRVRVRPRLSADDEAGVLEDADVLHHAEPAHGVGEPVGQLAHGLAVALEQGVEDLASGRVGERSEHLIHATENR